MSAVGALPARKAPAPAPLTDTVTVPRQPVKTAMLTLVPRTFIVQGRRGRVRLLMLARCHCGALSQHTSSRLDFAEGRRTGACGHRYVVRVGVVREPV